MSALESELAKVTEDFRVAKLAAKQAKAYAKVVKKEMKRVRKAWVNAQEEQDKATSTATPKKRAKAAPSGTARAKTKPVKSRKAKRPAAEAAQIVRKPRRKRTLPVATAANASGDSPTADLAGTPANEPQLANELPETTVSSEE